MSSTKQLVTAIYVDVGFKQKYYTHQLEVFEVAFGACRAQHPAQRVARARTPGAVIQHTHLARTHASLLSALPVRVVQPAANRLRVSRAVQYFLLDNVD